MVGERGTWYYIMKRDGTSLATRDKSSLQGRRCDQLEVMWRMADKDLRESIAGTNFKLQVAEYWKIMLNEAEALCHPAHLLPCRLLLSLVANDVPSLVIM